MKWILFCAHRSLRSVPLLIGLVLCALAAALSPLAGAGSEYPPAGVFDADGGEDAARLADMLCGMGFVRCSDEGELRGAVTGGALDCGVVINPGLSRRLAAASCDGALTLFAAPTTTMEEAYRLTAVSCLYDLVSPHLAADALEGAGVAADGVFIEYDALTERGMSFRFEIGYADPDAAVLGARAGSVARGALAFAALVMTVCSLLPLLTRELGQLAQVAGLRRALFTLLVPTLAVRTLLLFAALCAGCAAAAALGYGFMTGLMLPSLVYLLMLDALTLLLAALFSDRAYAALPLLAAEGFALCPIYTDAALLYPALGGLRAASPMYWLWLAEKRPAACALIAAAALAVSSAVFVAAYARRGRYRLSPPDAQSPA